MTGLSMIGIAMGVSLFAVAAVEAPLTLPADSQAAVQDLRLVASVELSYFQSKKRFGAVAEMKAARFLDPKWPRTPGASYRLSCRVEAEDRGFSCFADGVTASQLFFQVDQRQAVRFQKGRRPGGSSPVLRLQSPLLRTNSRNRKDPQ